MLERGPWSAAAWLVTLLCASNAFAQRKPEPTPVELPPADADAAGEVVVVFVLPGPALQVDAALRDALLAQFGPLDVRIALLPSVELGSTPAERSAAMLALGYDTHALAVFAVQPQENRRWALHQLDVERERLLTRTFDASPDYRAAAIEMVALVCREATRALIEGAPMPEPEPEPAPVPVGDPVAPRPEPTPPKPEPTPAPQVEPPASSGPPRISGPKQPPVTRPLRLSAAYSGTDFAYQIPPRHGAALGIGWHAWQPLYAAFELELTPPVAVSAPVVFDVLRLPAHLAGGYRYEVGKLSLAAELALTVELLRRTAPKDQVPAPGFVAEVNSSRFDALVLVGLRARAEYRVSPLIGVFAVLGFAAAINNFSYLYELDGGTATLLSLLPFRPVWQLGGALYL